MRFGFVRSRTKVFVAHSLHVEFGGDLWPDGLREIKPGKVGVVEVDRPFEHRIVEKGAASKLHAAETGIFFSVLKLCLSSCKIADDVRPDEIDRPFEHGIAENGVASDFHAAE